MFTAQDIARARRMVKVANALAAPAAAPATNAAPKQLDPYQYNSEAYWNPDVKSMGWNPPNQPGFWGSAGKSIGGSLLKIPGVDLARSYMGLAPGRSGMRNMLGGAPSLLGAKIFKDPQWEAEARSRMNDGGIGWAAPWQRAEEQSSQYQKALPQYLEKHAPFFAHPIETTHKFLHGQFGTKYPYP